MNFEKIRQRFFDKKGANIDLTIIDTDNNTIHLKLHEFVSVNSCDFFESMISFPNTSKNIFTIEVPDAHVTHDIIASFYGVDQNSTDYPDWKYILQMLICKNYLCLPTDITQLYNLVVPPQGFDLFFRVTELFGNICSDYRLMEAIKRNLPSDYDMTRFSEDFLEELFNKIVIVSVSGYYDNKKIKMWDVETGECSKTLERQFSAKGVVAVSYDTKLIVSVTSSFSDNNSKIKIWNAQTDECLKTLDTYSHIICSIAFSSDAKLIVSGDYDNNIRIRDTEITGKCLKTFTGHTNMISAVAFSTDNKLIVSGGYDSMIKIWDVETYECLKTLHTNWASSLAFSSDNKLIVVGGYCHSVEIWNVDRGECLKTLEGHSGTVMAAAFSRDAKLILSGSSNNIIKMWDAVTGECLKTLEGHSGHVYSVSFLNF